VPELQEQGPQVPVLQGRELELQERKEQELRVRFQREPRAWEVRRRSKALPLQEGE
jgi:hypothetical protein